MRRAGIGGTAAQIVGGLTRLEQAPLRGRQPFVRGALRRFELRDRRAPFLLTAIETVALLFGLTTLARELLALLREAGRLIGGALQLQFVADDRFLVFVMVGVERGDGVRRLRDRPFEAGRLFRQPEQRVAFGLNPVAQLLDLALGL